MNSEETRSFVLGELRANKLGVHFHPLCLLDISPKFQSAEFRGDSAIGFLLQTRHYSFFIIHPCSLVGKIKAYL
jgi:hypothetical protein